MKHILLLIPALVFCTTLPAMARSPYAEEAITLVLTHDEIPAPIEKLEKIENKFQVEAIKILLLRTGTQISDKIDYILKINNKYQVAYLKALVHYSYDVSATIRWIEEINNQLQIDKALELVRKRRWVARNFDQILRLKTTPTSCINYFPSF